ncbi:hypothetical protein F5148DRAFT_730728 [Russula earlei]|uniref:Uncharacterized protein n=1 Tax=Russula earlei TaxID=71964 RepID=A0ACC0ULZ8_9AGAM|nr:hypothetical protein F5148DRAFT_730728 [Russula earlei]
MVTSTDLELEPFPLPLISGPPPTGFELEEPNPSDVSRTTAFRNGIDHRDVFLGKTSCIICGSLRGDYVHIISKLEHELQDLRSMRWIPRYAKKNPTHESRNGMYLCMQHEEHFNAYEFFIRYMPTIQKFIFINYSRAWNLHHFHGKAIPLDINDRHCPFPSLFVLHEWRVRGFHPFKPPTCRLPSIIHWQGWVVKDDLFDEVSGTFRRERKDNHTGSSSAPATQPATATYPGVVPTDGSAFVLSTLNDNVVAEIVAATRASATWKACVTEGISWEGTAEENIQKYKDAVSMDE